MGERRKPKRSENLWFAEGAHIENGDIDIDNFYHSANNSSMMDSVVTGSHFAALAHRLILNRVMVFSYEGLAGSSSSEYVADSREKDNKRSLNSESLIATDCILYGKNMARNLNGGTLRNVVIGGVGVLKDATGVRGINVTIIDENGVRFLKDEIINTSKPTDKNGKYTTVSSRFVGGNPHK